MFDFFKKKMGVDEFSKNLINLVARENKQDRMFTEDAAQAGIAADTFRLEHLALRVCTAILVMRYVLHGALWEDFLENAQAAFQEYVETLGRMDQIVHGSRGFQNLDEFVWARLVGYANVIDTSEQGTVSANVGTFFSKLCCGNPNMTLCRIGDSTYLVRGDSLLRIARKLKFIGHADYSAR